MAFTLIATSRGAEGTGATSTTLDCTTALNVAAGDVLVAFVKHEGATTTIAVAKTTGGNSHTFDAGDQVNHTNGDLHSAFGYVLSAAADASFTARVTLGAARAFRTIIVHQFRPDAGETVSKDTSNASQGNSGTVNSGNITTTGTDEVAVGAHGEYSPETGSRNINAVAADGFTVVNDISANNTSAWRRILSATFAGGAATMAITSGDWTGHVIAIKSVAAGGATTRGTPFGHRGTAFNGGRTFHGIIQ